MRRCPRSSERGLGELLAVLFLGVVGLSWAALELERRGEEAERDRAWAAGALFASWMQAAHQRAQEAEAFYVAALGSDPGVSMTAAELRANGPVSCVPVGSVNCLGPVIADFVATDTALGQSIELGVIDDGFGVPMAFVVASPAPSRSISPVAGEAFRAGAAAGGVVGIEEFSGTNRWFELGGDTFDVNIPGSVAAAREDAIEHALGRALSPGDFVAVADLAIVFDEAHVHRRRQPGRAYLSEMRTDLRFASGTGIPFERDAMDDPVADTGAGLVVAERVETSGMFLVGRDASVGNDLRASCSPLPCEAAEGAASVEVDVVDVVAMPSPATGGGSLAFTGALEAGRLAVTGAVEGASGDIREYLTMARATVSRLLDGGPRLAVEDALEATGELDGHDVEASSVRGEATGGLSGTVEATATARGEHSSASELRIAGQLQVTDKCFGCVIP